MPKPNRLIFKSDRFRVILIGERGYPRYKKRYEVEQLMGRDALGGERWQLLSSDERCETDGPDKWDFEMVIMEHLEALDNERRKAEPVRANERGTLP